MEPGSESQPGPREAEEVPLSQIDSYRRDRVEVLVRFNALGKHLGTQRLADHVRRFEEGHPRGLAASGAAR